MNRILIRFKNFGMLEFLVIVSVAYIIFMLVWTLSNRTGLEEKIEIVREITKKLLNLLTQK